MENYPATIPTVACCTAVFGPGRDGPNEEEVEGQGSYLAVYKASTNSTTMMVLPVTARASSIKYFSILSEFWIQLLLRCVQNWSEETSSSEDAGRCQDGDQRETLGADTGRHLMMRPGSGRWKLKTNTLLGTRRTSGTWGQAYSTFCLMPLCNDDDGGEAIRNRPSRKPSTVVTQSQKIRWDYFTITITTMKVRSKAKVTVRKVIIPPDALYVF